MNVRELITELLDHDVESEVEIELNLNDGSEVESFNVDESGGQIYLTVELFDSALINASELNEMEEKIQSLGDVEE